MQFNKILYRHIHTKLTKHVALITHTQVTSSLLDKDVEFKRAVATFFVDQTPFPGRLSNTKRKDCMAQLTRAMKRMGKYSNACEEAPRPKDTKQGDLNTLQVKHGPAKQRPTFVISGDTRSSRST